VFYLRVWSQSVGANSAFAGSYFSVGESRRTASSLKLSPGTNAGNQAWERNNAWANYSTQEFVEYYVPYEVCTYRPLTAITAKLLTRTGLLPGHPANAVLKGMLSRKVPVPRTA
jgi:hypothetical protein